MAQYFPLLHDPHHCRLNLVCPRFVDFVVRVLSLFIGFGPVGGYHADLDPRELGREAVVEREYVGKAHVFGHGLFDEDTGFGDGEGLEVAHKLGGGDGSDSLKVLLMKVSASERDGIKAG